MSEAYIGLLTVAGSGNWRVSFPDIPGCVVWGDSFKDAYLSARKVLTERLQHSDRPLPRPRSTVDLLIDAQRDSAFRQQLVNAAMHPIEPESAKELAPLDVVAWRTKGGDGSNPKVGA